MACELIRVLASRFCALLARGGALAQWEQMGSCRKLADHAKREAIELRNACEPMHEIGLACNVSHGIVSKFVAGPLHAFGAKV